MKKLLQNLLVAAIMLSLFSCEKEEPTAMFTASKTIIDEGETVAFTNKSMNADHYMWYFGEGSTSTDENPTFTYNKKGMYNVTLIAYSKSGKQMDDAYLLYIYVYQTRLIFNITAGGSPVNNCTVDIYGTLANWSAKTNKLASAKSGTDGIVTFTGCQAQIYYVDFICDGTIYQSSSTEALTLHTDNCYNVSLNKTRLIYTVTMGGSPVSNCRVDVYGNSYDWSHKLNRLAYANTNTSGQVIFTGCQSQAYYLDFVYNGIIYNSVTTPILSANVDNTYSIVLSQTKLTFNITLDGSPISNCRVVIYGNNSDWSGKINQLSEVTTSSSGVATFNGLQSQTYYADFYYNSTLNTSYTTPSLTSNIENSYSVALINRKITFNNPTYTPIKITVDGYSQQTIPVGGSLTFSAYTASSVHFVAETNEYFSDGTTQLGLKLSWNTYASTPNLTNSANLNIGSSYCYFKIQNNGASHQLGPIYFNYGNTNQYYVNTVLPTSGGPYNFGYHYAIAGGQIRGYWYPSVVYYSYWTAGTQFNYPNTNNQTVTLTNTFKMDADDTTTPAHIYKSLPIKTLSPSKEFVVKFNESNDTQQFNASVVK